LFEGHCNLDYSGIVDRKDHSMIRMIGERTGSQRGGGLFHYPFFGLKAREKQEKSQQ